MARVMVTGASSGVGLALSTALAREGHEVILAVREEARGEAAMAQIRSVAPSAVLSLRPLDLCDLDSVRALGRDPFPLDVLVNNAGLAFDPLRRTAEGLVSQFAANHLGHFVLTALLLPRLARVVQVTSTLARSGALDLRDVDGSHPFDPLRAYTQSKRANVLFGAELDRRLRARGLPVKSVLAHPGVPRTRMQQKATGVLGIVVRTLAWLTGTPPEHGARAVLQAAVGDDVEGGDLWEPGRRIGDAPRRVWPAWPNQGNLEDAARLWSLSEDLGRVRFDL